MIWALAAHAVPGMPHVTEDEVRDAAQLVEDSQSIEGDVSGVTVSLTLTNRLPELSIVNSGDDALVVRWKDSTIAPPNSEPTPLLWGGSRVPEDGDTSSIAPGTTLAVRPIPSAWIEDGPENDDAQWSSWTDTSFVSLHLVVQRGRKKGTVHSELRTEFDNAALKQLELERAAAEAAEKAESLAADYAEHEALVMEAQKTWDTQQRGLRVQGKIARPIWITSGSVAAGTGLLALSAGSSIADAPDTARDPDELTKDDLRAVTRVYGAISGATLAIAIPTFIWDRSSRKKLRALGPRPRPKPRETP